MKLFPFETFDVPGFTVRRRALQAKRPVTFVGGKIQAPWRRLFAVERYA